ncbi:MAG: hypothetical protein WCJ37_18115 [Syntrophus sp. (in: bacteria)]
MNNNSYINSGGEAILVPSIVCHLDILGWTSLTEKAIESGEGLAFLRKIRETLGNAYRLLRKDATEPLRPNEQYYQIKTFTDNIVVAIPYRRLRLEGEAELVTIFNIFRILQLELVRNGLLLRGAVAFGDHYMDDDFVFGDALLEAVKYEKSGGPPRIVLGPSISKRVKTHIDFYSGHIRHTPHFGYLFMDTDGELFIDYLSRAFMAYPGPIFFDILESHRKLIYKNLKEYSLEEDTLKKYKWLAGYHNFVCNHFVSENPMPWEPDEEDYANFVEVQKVTNFLIDSQEEFPQPTHLEVWWNRNCCECQD